MSALGWLIAAVVLFAALLFAHALLLRGVFTSELSRAWKWGSLFPLITPVAAWKAKRHRRVILWSALLFGYIVIRLLAG
ncbi:MAG: hypothetical protein ACI9KE_005319 [Polyangiales bacterium]